MPQASPCQEWLTLHRDTAWPTTPLHGGGRADCQTGNSPGLTAPPAKDHRASSQQSWDGPPEAVIARGFEGKK